MGNTSTLDHLGTSQPVFFYLGCGQPVRHAWEWWNHPELCYLSCHFGHGEILGPRLLNQRSERLLENAHQLLDSVSPMWTPGTHYFAGCHDMVWSFDVFWRNTAVFHWNTLLFFFYSSLEEHEIRKNSIQHRLTWHLWSLATSRSNPLVFPAISLITRFPKQDIRWDDSPGALRWNHH